MITADMNIPTAEQRVARYPLLTDELMNRHYAAANPDRGSGKLTRAMIDVLRGERMEESLRTLADCGWLGASWRQIASEIEEQIRRS